MYVSFPANLDWPEPPLLDDHRVIGKIIPPKYAAIRLLQHNRMKAATGIDLKSYSLGQILHLGLGRFRHALLSNAIARAARRHRLPQGQLRRVLWLVYINSVTMSAPLISSWPLPKKLRHKKTY